MGYLLSADKVLSSIKGRRLIGDLGFARNGVRCFKNSLGIHQFLQKGKPGIQEFSSPFCKAHKSPFDLCHFCKSQMKKKISLTV